MRVRVAALGALAAAVVIGGVYLFLQVTSEPSAAATTAATGKEDREVTRVADTTPPPETGAMFSPPGANQGSAKRIPDPPPKVDMTASRTPTSTGPSIEAGGDDELTNPDVDLDLAMDEANKRYDDNDYDAAAKQALRVLEKQDLDAKARVRMLRIIVSSGCMMGDVDQATKYFDQLPPKDQGDMAKRCERFDIQLKAAKPKPT